MEGKGATFTLLDSAGGVFAITADAGGSFLVVARDNALNFEQLSR